MRDPMSTAAQAVVLLNLLAGHRFRWSLDAFSECRRAMWTAAGPTRQGRINVRLTPAGRDALARYLLRTFTGPVEVVEEQPIMFAEEALVMLEVVAGRDVGMPATMFRDWIRRSRGKLVATTAGREALVSYLLRDFHA